LALTLPWLAPGLRAGRFSMLPSVRTAIAAYIIIVAVVYHTMLSRLYHPQGWRLVCDIILHYVMPPLFVLDWALFVDKRDLSWTLPLHSFVLPAVYLLWTALHGAFAGFYPYPFLNVNRIGYEQSLVNVGGLIVAFVCLILALVGIGRVLSRCPHSEEHVR
jgi:hypothetical protein